MTKGKGKETMSTWVRWVRRLIRKTVQRAWGYYIRETSAAETMDEMKIIQRVCGWCLYNTRVAAMMDGRKMMAVMDEAYREIDVYSGMPSTQDGRSGSNRQ